MNKTDDLLDIASRISRTMEHPGIEAFVVGGSVAKGRADEYSDLEIGIFWKNPPPQTDRTALIEKLGSKPWRQLQSDVDATWWTAVDNFEHGDLSVDLAHNSLKGVNSVIDDVTLSYSIDISKLKMMSVLETIFPIRGEKLIQNWQARLRPYPKQLKVRLLETYIWFPPSGGILLHAKRNDSFMFYQQLLEYQRRLFIVLLALNEEYHPDNKKMEFAIETLKLAPNGLNDRLKRTFTDSKLENIWKIMADLIEETFDLISIHMPDIATDQAIRHFRHIRRKALAASKINRKTKL